MMMERMKMEVGLRTQTARDVPAVTEGTSLPPLPKYAV